jgi:hypothetical protein
MQAIETAYDGYRFRSRLEARWAVFFNALGVRYEYEKQGYVLNGVAYLPDFWLPHVGRTGIWVEIKGKEPTDAEVETCGQLCLESKAPVLIYSQDPYWPVPACVWMYFTMDEVLRDNRRLFKLIDAQTCQVRAIARDKEQDAAFTMTGLDPLVWGLGGSGSPDLYHVNDQAVFSAWVARRDEDHRVAAAYQAARSARFEHGESPPTGLR